ncbi:polymorphic toxin-type HINT domain-containing protein [Virgisporangium aliadipatigenens]|uniref:polymorphic toxin-type HINT domain-containing protein n=1 Tax=Virgisporangium aliadipatigenens TaxID=741659 RepID=UPI001944B650|nr:polymorphic toxin-type HINT domain-containing protein [Virgisporangium aliadipatigenens]
MSKPFGRTRAAIVGLCATLVVTLAGTGPALAAPAKAFDPTTGKPIDPVEVEKVPARRPSYPPAKDATTKPAPVWPSAGSATLDLRQSQPSARAADASAAVAGLPVSVTNTSSSNVVSAGAGSSRVRVDVLDQEAAKRSGTTGVLFRVTPADSRVGTGALGVTVDYGQFATAFGGDWASRLRLVAMPECALTTPGAEACRGTVLPSRNDTRSRRVSADVGVGSVSGADRDERARAGASGGVLLALAAGPSGAAGSYAATSLSASSTWSAGGSSGDFSWSYPMRTPPALGGPSPTVSLSYSAQSVDGRMAASNNQPSVVGEGFELNSSGYIERRYKDCSEDRANGANNTEKTGDQCWATDNATMNLGGRSVELIKDAGDANVWHPRTHDGSRVQRRYGQANGAKDGEWWVVTTTNGTQYWFGRNRLPGWASGNTETGSVWTAPVFGNHANEPCHQATFAASVCTQAYRWNLDYVVDPNGNTMSFWYSSESNKYAQNLKTSAPVSYVRAGQLDRVEYGTRNDNADPQLGTDTVFAGTAAARVLYGYDDRCKENCATHGETQWPDTPWDLECKGSTCDNVSPTFWTTRRLKTVTTQVRNAAANDFRDVERWTFTHSYPDPEDSTRAGLWLDRISHVGLVGGTTTLPDVTLHGEPMHNRVDTVDNAPSMNWRRLVGIETETGGSVQVEYSQPQCVAGGLMPDRNALQNNTLRCYPVKWTRSGDTQSTLDFFHKYRVDKVIETDWSGNASRVVHRYNYIGDPAWHFTDDDGLISEDGKTYSQWRGYARVGELVGDPGEQTYSESLYYRGMNGDKLPSGTRAVTVTDSQGGAGPDEDWFAGMTRETRTLDGGPDGAEISGVVNEPWSSGEIATRTVNGAKVAARYTNVQATQNRTARDKGRLPLRTGVRKEFDAYGMTVKVDDAGDLDVPGDEQCSTTTYEPRNTGAWLMSLPHQARSVGLACAAADGRLVAEGDIIGDGRTSYDGQDWGVAPKKGNVTKVEQLATWNGTAATYLTVSRSAYDKYGRVTESWDVLGNRSATAYTPSEGGPVTQTVDTNVRGWTNTSTIEPAFGLATSTVDINQRRTDLRYDGLGRLTDVWLPERPRAQHENDPSMRYAYLIRKDGAVAVTTQKLNPAGNYISTYTLYDGLLRPRQTQAASPDARGGRMLTDQIYDTAGRVKLKYGTYYSTGAPGVDLVAAPDPTDVPDQTATVYDGAGRVKASIFKPAGVERWRTTTSYGGDRTDVVPPAGGVATSSIVDGRGHTVEKRTYRGRDLSGDYDAITYTYNHKNLLAAVQDPAGNRWEYTYDVRGRKISSKDPDSGTSSTTYDDAGRVTSTTDARGKKLFLSYDNLSRKTALRGDSTTGPQLAGWTYDSVPLPDGTLAKGKPATSVRYNGTDRYTTEVTYYDNSYKPTQSAITIPLSEGAIAGTYYYDYAYNPDGSLNSLTMPRTGDLTLESLAVEYTELGLPQRLTTFYGLDHQSYVSDTRYNALAQPEQYTLYQGMFSGAGSRVYQYFERELGTGRLTKTWTERDGVSPNLVSEVTYGYDDAGKVLRAADAAPGRATDVQCYDYDSQMRLSEAWTPASGDCSQTRATGTLGGPAPYWQSWTYDALGRRQTQTDHSLNVGGDTVTSYDYPDDGGSQPHTLTGQTRSVGGVSTTTAFTFDAAGNTLTRLGPGGEPQTLTWDREGKLATTSDATGSTSYVYDAGGQRLIRRDAKGKTLYLPGAELRWDKATNAKTCTRFYEFGGGPVAQRTAAGVTWLTTDYHGTQQIAIDAATQNVTQRRETPFGLARGVAPTWVNEKGFVGGTVDPTGLTHLGAREYDPALGRFVSVDPIVDYGDLQQMNGYSYANNMPTSASDPDGLKPITDDQYYGNYINSNETKGTGSTGSNNTQTSGGSGGGGKNGGGGGKKVTNKCSTWDVACKTRSGFSKALNWADDHKADIAGFVAGAAVGIGCGFAIGWTGAGAVACGALAGAVGSAVTYAYETKVEGKGEFSWGQLGAQAAIGGLIGGALGGLGSMVGAGIKAGFSSLASGVGAKAATQAAGRGFAAEGRAIASGFRRGGGAKSVGSSGGRPTACSASSFTAGTAVRMADGSGKSLEKVKVGDRVLAADPVDGRPTEKPVTATIASAGQKKLVTIIVRPSGTGTGTRINATANHPFWVPDLRRWLPAGELSAGQWLLASNGERVQVSAIEIHTETTTVLDLTVADLHTFFVLSADADVLVHNCGGTQTAPSGQPHSTSCTCATGGKPRIVRNTGGMRGDTATRTQDIGLQFDIMDAEPGWTHVAGGTKPQRAVKDPSGNRKFPDLTFRNDAGETVYYQTADFENGAFTDRELLNAEFIATYGAGQIILIPKL